MFIFDKQCNSIIVDVIEIIFSERKYMQVPRDFDYYWVKTKTRTILENRASKENLSDKFGVASVGDVILTHISVHPVAEIQVLVVQRY